MSKARVYLAQVNNRFGANVHLPYSVGLLWSYAQTFPEITERYELAGFLYDKEPIERAVARLESPDVLGLSSYIWNHRWNLAFARAAHERWPACSIVMGGPHVPEKPGPECFADGAIRMLIHGEGEAPFAAILRWLASDRFRPTSATHELGHREIAGISYRRLVGTEAHWTVITQQPSTPPPTDAIPSPYLSGVFDELMPLESGWQAPQETHRGCAYRCTFCEWGSSYYQKIREFDTARVEAEFEWFAKHKIEYIENCDANYGLLPRDLDMTARMVAVKEKYGYPKRFRAAFAKNSGDRVFAISKMLFDAGMHKATTVALQSMDPQVLVNISRKNIKDATEPLLKRYADAGIPTYSELILGLPGETLASFKKGVGDLLDAGQHSALFIYNCVTLPNTPFMDPAYVRAHGIETVDMQAMLLHATPEPGAITEIQPTVIATAAMPHKDWRDGWLFAWAVHTFHCLGLLRHVAIECRDADNGIRYERFYTKVLEWADLFPDTVLGREVRRARALLERGLAGGSWDLVDPLYGDISWPPDEYAFLQIVLRLDQFYDELEPEWGFLIGEQRDLIVRPGEDLEAYARELVWYGRKGADKRLRRKEAS